jgi:outer membrane protein assembly factor BamB
MKRPSRWGALPAAVLLAIVVTCFAVPPEEQDVDRTATQPAALTIDLDEAVSVTLPDITADLEAVEFTTPDDKKGWVLRIPGSRPIATPAYADGMIFVGGGYGSHEFYAFDAATGRVVWQMKTGDDGPTAAVVEDGCVAFNTESCTIYVVDAKTGKVLWQEWLGDPLMSQPAIADGRLYMVYPAGQRAKPNGQQQAQSEAAAPEPAMEGAAANGGGSHRLLCADLKTGRHLWEQSLTSDAISAPVVDGQQVYVTCFDGTSFCIEVADGDVVWTKQNAGTSAPLVADGHVVVTQRQQGEEGVREGMKRLDPVQGEERDSELLAAGKAGYLQAGGRTRARGPRTSAGRCSMRRDAP